MENIEHDTDLDNYSNRKFIKFFSSHNISVGENVEVGIVSKKDKMCSKLISDVRVMFFDLIPLAKNVQ